MTRHPSTFPCTIVLLALVALLAPVAVSAQRPVSGRDAAPDPDQFVLTADEQLILSEQLGDRKTVNVAEQYKSLLTREAIPVVPSERGDPMVVPFINDKVVLQQMFARMEESFATGSYDVSIVFAKQIAQKYPNTEEARRAQELIQIIGVNLNDPNRPTDATGRDPEIDRWVVSNLKAILYDTEDPQVLVGYDVLRVGDSVPSYPNHVIDEILPDSVIFRVSNEFRTKRIELSVSARD